MPFFILNSPFQSYTALNSSLIELNFSLKRTKFSFYKSVKECDSNHFGAKKKYNCSYKRYLFVLIYQYICICINIRITRIWTKPAIYLTCTKLYLQIVSIHVTSYIMLISCFYCYTN